MFREQLPQWVSRDEMLTKALEAKYGADTVYWPKSDLMPGGTHYVIFAGLKEHKERGVVHGAIDFKPCVRFEHIQSPQSTASFLC